MTLDKPLIAREEVIRRSPGVHQVDLMRLVVHRYPLTVRIPEAPPNSASKLKGTNLQLAVRIVAWSLAAAILVLSLVPSDLRPETGVPHKLEHLLIFAATGAAFGLGYEAKRGLLAVQLVIFAGAVEIAQLFVQGRHARLNDFLVDAVAICAGSIVGSLTKQVRPA